MTGPLGECFSDEEISIAAVQIDGAIAPVFQNKDSINSCSIPGQKLELKGSQEG